jgi:uncharacterized membrane protein HdeD (DUF308 family)
LGTRRVEGGLGNVAALVVRTTSRKEVSVIILGIILLIIGFVVHIAILWTIGIIVLLIGLIMAVLGMVGHGFHGRRHYF